MRVSELEDLSVTATQIREGSLVPDSTVELVSSYDIIGENLIDVTFNISDLTGGRYSIDLGLSDYYIRPIICYIDHTAPSITSIYPDNGSNIEGEIDLSVSAEDDVGIQSVTVMYYPFNKGDKIPNEVDDHSYLSYLYLDTVDFDMAIGRDSAYADFVLDPVQVMEDKENGGVLFVRYVVTDVSEKTAERTYKYYIKGTDSVMPEVLSVSPEIGSTIDSNTDITVQVSDNIEVATLNVEYSTDIGEYSVLTIPVGAESAYVTIPHEILSLDGASELHLMLSCTDSNGNTCESVAVYYLFDIVPPDAVALWAEETMDGIVLSWPPVYADDLAGFRIYRRTEGSDFTQIAAFAPDENVNEYTYVDRTVQYDETYYYYVTSEDHQGNTSSCDIFEIYRNSYDHLVTYLDTEAPVAQMILYRYGYVDESLVFDARDSHDNGRIDIYRWDFGDGTTDSGVQVEKSFAESGVYTILLTVMDAAGNYSTQTASIMIKPKKTSTGEDEGGATDTPDEEYADTGELIVKVLDNSGNAISGAKVCFDLRSDDMQPFYTGYDGTVRIRDVGGTYEIGAYKNGYMPCTTIGEIVIGEEKTIELRMGKSEIIAGTLEAERMTVEEIENVGIDTNDPANQFVYKFEIELEYSLTPPSDNTSGGASGSGGTLGVPSGGGGGSSVTFKFPSYANSEGAAVGETQKPTVITPPESSEKIVVLPPTFVPTGGDEAPVPVVGVIRLPGEATWLKDFFEVSMEIINLAPNDSNIVLQNCVAELAVPDGLTLMDSMESSKDTVYYMKDIPANSSKKAVWILRGDKAGSYDLSAEFSGDLANFGETVKAVFYTEEPIRVRAGDNLYMDIIVEDTVPMGADSAIMIGLRNEDSEPYYLPNITLEKAIKKGDTYKTSGDSKTIFNLDTLYPGEEIWFEYIIRREDFRDVFENEGSDYYLVDQVARYVEGVELQTTFQYVPPYTISGDLIEVYYVDPESGVLASANYIDIETDSSNAQMPDLVIKTYRLINDEYQLCPMEFTVTDPLRAEENAGDRIFSGKTESDGTYTIKGYEIAKRRSEENYTVTVQSKRAPKVEIPVSVIDNLGVGNVTVNVYEFDGIERTAIANALVTIADQTITTDSNGVAFFEDIENGKHNIQVTADGYFDYADTARIKSETQLDICVTKNTGSSTVYGIKMSVNQNGSSVFIPYGMVTGQLGFTMKRNIVAGESYKCTHYKIVHADTTAGTHGTFIGDSLSLDVSLIKGGSKVYFAVETDKGLSEYVAADLTVAPPLNLITDLASKIQNITMMTKSKFSISIDSNFFIDLLTFNETMENKTEDIVKPYTKFSSNTETADLINKFKSHTGKNEVSLEQKLVYGIALEFDFAKGEYSIPIKFGKTNTFKVVLDGKERDTEDKKDEEKAENEQTTTHKTANESVGTIIFRYDGLRGKWRWSIGLHKESKYTKVLIPKSTLWISGPVSLNWSVDAIGTGNIDIELPSLLIGQDDTVTNMKATMIDKLNNVVVSDDFKFFDIGGSIGLKISLFEQFIDDWVQKAGAYLKPSVSLNWTCAPPLEFDVGMDLKFELGYEANLFIFEASGKWVEWEPFEDDTQQASVYATRAIQAASDTSSANYSIVKAPGSVQWNGKPVNNVLQSEVFSRADQQVVTLENGTKLMVFADTDISFDENNPVKLKYSVNTNGNWSTPSVVCSDDTIDLQPSLTAFGDRAVLVWQDMGQQLEPMGMLSVEDIRKLYGSTEIRIAEFDGTSWSEPMTISAGSCLVYNPTVATNGNTVMTVWMANESNIEKADADTPDVILYALSQGGTIIDSGKLVDTYSTVSNLELTAVDGTYMMTCTAKNADGKYIAYRSMYSSDSSEWESAEKISNLEASTVALTTAEDGTIYYIMDGRLYRAGKTNEVLVVSDTLNKAEELSVLQYAGNTYFAWVGTPADGTGLFLCYMDTSGNVSEPVQLITGKTERYDTPVLVPNTEDSILAVYLTAVEDADYPDDYVLNYTLNCASIATEQDISVDKVSHSQPLYAGAEVTTDFVCKNLGLISVSEVTAAIYDADGSLVKEVTELKPTDTIVWTVPDNYDGEIYTLKVIPAIGNDVDEANNTAVIDHSFTDMEIIDVNYVGEEGEATSMILSLKNRGSVTSRGVKAVVSNRITDTKLAEISLGDIAGGTETDYRISVEREGYTDLVVIIESGGYELSSDNNNDYIIIENEINIVGQHIHDYSNNGVCECGMLNVAFAGGSLSLGDNIAVHFYMEIDKAILADKNAYMLFTMAGGSTLKLPMSYAVNNTAVIQGKTYNIFTCTVNAKEMTDTIKAQIFSGENASAVFEYSVRRYAELMIENETMYADKAVALVKAMLNYGTYAQKYFGYNTGFLANSDIGDTDAEEIASVTAEDLQEHKTTNVELEGYGTFVGSSLALKDRTILLSYFALEEGVDISDLKFTANGEEVVPVWDKTTGYYTLSLSNIAASDLDRKYEFTATVCNDTSKTVTTSCSTLSYCYSVLQSGRYGEKLNDLVRSIYLYNQAANAYVGK